MGISSSKENSSWDVKRRDVLFSDENEICQRNLSCMKNTQDSEEKGHAVIHSPFVVGFFFFLSPSSFLLSLCVPFLVHVSFSCASM